MHKETDIQLPANEFPEGDALLNALSKKERIRKEDIRAVKVVRRSVDARKRFPLWSLRVWYSTDAAGFPPGDFQLRLQNVSLAEPVLITGFGPAGMFAALRLIELGFKPVIVERGKEVRGRRRDLAVLNREGIVNADSNYCFGEGGAGTFSDGKLYTRSNKRGDIRRILEIFVRMGASPDILVDAHPHIGTNKLPAIIEQIRSTILDCGGEIHFGERMQGIELAGGSIRAIRTQNGKRFEGRALILATGHSARDIFYLLHENGIRIEAKPFALGVRAEHPQSLIDSIQFHCETRPLPLPAASYSLVTQVEAKGVFSFCMCPGGIICPASTAENELVVNGWSPSKRNSAFANSGIVTEITEEDLKPFAHHGVFAGLEFQRQTEQRAFAAGGGNMVAPASRLSDFVNRKISSSLPESSYLPGLNSADMSSVFSSALAERLRAGFRDFGKKMKGYLSNEAIVVATESRTSSPVRIPRDKESLMHPEVPGLFPCGEGAGYAGGIVSAAMDGENCAFAAARMLKSAHPEK